MSKEKIDLTSKVEILEKKMAEEITRKENEFSKMVDTLKDDAAQSYIVDFEVALEQATLVHPPVDFSELIPCKTIVDGKLIGDS